MWFRGEQAMATPTPEAWHYFTKHLSDIRDVVSMFLPVPRMEIPNTRGPVPDDEHAARVSAKMPPQAPGEQRGTRPLEVRLTITDFDKAVEDKDTNKLAEIMNSAWLRAPESRDVYHIPGFTEMCNLLDCTVDGFLPEPD
jgi:hypothetical protein